MDDRERILVDKLISGIDEVIKNDYDKYNRQKVARETIKL